MRHNIVVVSINEDDEELIRQLMKLHPQQLKSYKDVLLWALRQNNKTNYKLLADPIFKVPGINPYKAPRITIKTRKDVIGKLRFNKSRYKLYGKI